MPESDHTCYIVIRPASEEKVERLAREQLIRDSLAALNTQAFFLFLFQEVTLQVIVLGGAVLFIFFGVSITTCLLLLPFSAVLIYLLVLLGHGSLADKHVQESRMELFGAVAELHAPIVCPHSHSQIPIYTRLDNNEFDSQNVNKKHRKRVVGTVSVSPMHEVRGGWLHALAVLPDPSMNAGSVSCALVTACRQLGCVRALPALETVTGTLQDLLRNALYSTGWVSLGSYHRRLCGGAVTLALTHHRLELPCA